MVGAYGTDTSSSVHMGTCTGEVSVSCAVDADSRCWCTMAVCMKIAGCEGNVEMAGLMKNG